MAEMLALASFRTMAMGAARAALGRAWRLASTVAVTARALASWCSLSHFHRYF